MRIRSVSPKFNGDPDMADLYSEFVEFEFVNGKLTTLLTMYQDI